MSLEKRLDRLEQQAEAAEMPPAALVVMPGESEEDARARFLAERGYALPAAHLILRLTEKDCRIRPDPDEVSNESD